MIKFTLEATDFSNFHSTVLPGYFFLGNKMIHLEREVVFDLIVMTVGEEDLTHSCDEETFSDSVVQNIVRKKV